MTGAAIAAAAGAIGRTSRALSSVTIGGRAHGRILVVLFLRGGADGLNIVVPYGDADYYRLRPTLAIPTPGDRTAPAKARALDLNGFFGLHPSLSDLVPLYHSGQLAAVQAVGSDDQTRSHFEAMATMERGLARDTGAASGWLARYLNATIDPHDSPLRAVAISDTVPDSLRGATSATAMLSLSEFQLKMPTGAFNRQHHAAPLPETYTAALREMYRTAGSENNDHTIGTAGVETIRAMEAVQRLDPAHYRPTPGVTYPNTDLASAMRQVACLAKGDVGLEVACLDMGGWDTHVAQGRDSGWQPARIKELGGALAAFGADLGSKLNDVTVVVMTEFGRRAYENSGLGTDHGHGSCMLLLGGGVHGGQVHARWPGLAEHKLTGPGDLQVTTDYRDVLAEILHNRMGCGDLESIFPEYTPTAPGIVAAA